MELKRFSAEHTVYAVRGKAWNIVNYIQKKYRRKFLLTHHLRYLTTITKAVSGKGYEIDYTDISTKPRST